MADNRRELAALKANTMAILHPEQTKVKEEKPQSILAALTGNTNAVAGPSQPMRKSVTPQFNPNKDIPSASYGMWGANGPFGSGGSTICHTMLTDDLVLDDHNKPKAAATLLRGLPEMPRMNMNPHLNDETIPRMPSLSATANARDLNDTFSDWSETNAFTLRSMDSYRVQMWSRLAREASSDKQNLPQDVRPKFFVEPSAAAAAATYASAAQGHITSKLASSFWSAFAGSNGKMDSDKLAAVVTGQARLRVVEVEKEKDEAELLAAALGGLRLQSGLTRSEGTCLRARENPLGAIGSFFKCSGGICRAA